MWVHALSGVLWVGACATFVIAAAALAGEPDESLAFARRAAPQINRLCATLCVAIPISGLANLLFAAQAHGSVLPDAFIRIVIAKIGLLTIMVLALLGAWRASRALLKKSAASMSESGGENNIRRLMIFYGLTSGAGMMALGLGLWLTGI